MIKYSIKLFTHHRIIRVGFPLLCTALLSFVIYHYCRYDNHLDVCSIVHPLMLAIKVSPLFFLGITLFSYEYYYSPLRYDFKEVVLSSQRGKSPFAYTCSFATVLCFSLLFIVVLTALLFFFFSGTGADIRTVDQSNAYYRHILKNIAIYYVLPSVVAIETGWIISLFEKKATAYAIMSSIFFFVGGFAETIAGTLMLVAGIDIYGIINVVSLFPQGLDWTTNFHYGYSVMAYQVCRGMAWAALLFIIIIMSREILIERKIAITLCAMCVAIIVLSSVRYFSEESRVIYNRDPRGSLVADQWYYLEKKPIKEIVPQFSIVNYDMNLEIDRQMKSVVTVKPDKSDLREYRFTLYHGFQVQEIEGDNKMKLRFKQQGDHIVVNTPEGAELKTITFKYNGYSNQYYSNRQGVFLPAYFPYYPMPGVFDLNKREGIVKQDETSQIKMRVRTVNEQRVYCNLESKGDGHFEGESSGVTLMSGFISEKSNNGSRVIFPFLSDECSNANINGIFKLIDKKGYSKNTVFIVPNVNQKMTVITYDDMIMTPWIIGESDVDAKEK